MRSRSGEAAGRGPKKVSSFLSPSASYSPPVWPALLTRSTTERLLRTSLPAITIQPIFHGVETTEDKIFWKHYVNHLSNVLTVEGESKNAFKDIILNLAVQHQGLMHSILALSSRHIDLSTPYGGKLLLDNPTTSREALRERSDHHHDRAMTKLYEDMAKQLSKDDPEYETILSARYGQMLCLLLQTRAEGNPRGEHRLHLQAYQALIEHSPPQDTTLHTFITEFFQFHIYADDLLWHPETMTKRLGSEEWAPSIPIHPQRLLGVADGLFSYLSQITTIRNTIRANIFASIDPLVNYTSLYRAAELDAAIREWTPQWPFGDSRESVALLYKQTVWVYLFRTIYPPTPPPTRRNIVTSLPMALASSPTTPQRRASMAGSVTSESSGPVFGHGGVSHSCPSSRGPSRQSSMHEQDSQPLPNGPNMLAMMRGASPPPQRRPTHQDRRITMSVEESLGIMESIKPSDPVQTLLLMPCLVIGTACFEVSQRERIRAALKAVKGYTGLRNCDRVTELLEEIWVLMDRGDWLSVWDWQGVANRLGLDFVCI